MIALFATSFFVGLVLGVVAMLVGVERRASRTAFPSPVGPLPTREALMAASSQISARFQVPLIAAFTTGFGAIGYPLARYSTLSPAWQLVLAALGGGLAATGAVTLIARWAVPSARRDVPDERYLLQGMLARVTDAIEQARPGRIALEVDGILHAVRAMSLTGDPIERGVEVVIERIERDTAFVEPWAQVERRL
jgi:membrane protein implicated in regulation of membrane protease activity